MPDSSTRPRSLPPQIQSFIAAVQERRARTATDRALARRLHGAFESAEIEVAGLTLHVHDGAIALYGTVRTEAHREAALALAAEQPGARRITDHLRLPAA